MPAVVTAINRRRASDRTSAGGGRCGHWCLLEVAQPGSAPVPLGILLVDDETDQLSLRMLGPADVREPAKQNFAEQEPAKQRFPEQEPAKQGFAEQEIDILDFLPGDLLARARESGGRALLDSLEDSLSDFFRISDRTAISYTGDAQQAADRLFDEYVDAEVRPFVSHLPLYTLRAAATKFGEGMDSEQDGWVRARGRLRLTPDMFVARVVGRSMEPLIPDGSLCVFRTGVVGSRQGKRLLIEKFGETDFGSRYTVKRYTSVKKQGESEDSWEHDSIRLEPLNPEFDAFELGPDGFRVIAEFVEVLES